MFYSSDRVALSVWSKKFFLFRSQKSFSDEELQRNMTAYLPVEHVSTRA